jgi:hypothetical protein
VRRGRKGTSGASSAGCYTACLTGGISCRRDRRHGRSGDAHHHRQVVRRN